VLFSHLFKMEKRYQAKSRSFAVTVFEFHKFLNPPYVEKEVLDRLLGQRKVEDMTLREINQLLTFISPWRTTFSTIRKSVDENPHCLLQQDFPKATDSGFGQKRVEEKIFHRKVRAGLHAHVFGPEKSLRVTLEDLKREVAESRLAGCPLALSRITGDPLTTFWLLFRC